MIIPWQSLPEDTLENIVESVILREGTDYGCHELTFEQKNKIYSARFAKERP